MKRFLLIASAAALLMTSCSEEKFLNISGVEEATTKAPGTIEFQASRPNQSRAEIALENFTSSFGVFGIKANLNNTGATDMPTFPINHNSTHEQLVFNNYLVGHTGTYPVQEGGVTETDPNTYNAGWFYEGLGTQEYNYPTDLVQSVWKNQYLKYWDGSYKYTYFIAYTPYDNSTDVTIAPIISAPKDDNYLCQLTVQNPIKVNSDAPFMVAAQKEVNSSHIENTTTVPLHFNHFQSQIRIAFYEVIKGYKVKMINIKGASGTYGAIAVPYKDNVTSYGEGVIKYSRDVFVNIKDDAGVAGGKCTCDFDYNVTAGGTNNVDKSYVFDFEIENLYSGSPKGNREEYLLEERTNKVFSPTVFNVFPRLTDTESNPDPLQFVLSFQLEAEDTGEVIKVTNARVDIPADYVKWKKDCVYTYVFKIIKNTNGTTVPPSEDYEPTTPVKPDATPALYPIVFDNLTVEELTAAGNTTEYTLYDANNGHNPTATDDPSGEFIFKSGVAANGEPKDFAEVGLNKSIDLKDYMVDAYANSLTTDSNLFTFNADQVDGNDIVQISDAGVVKGLALGWTTIHVEYSKTTTDAEGNSTTVTAKDALVIYVVNRSQYLKEAICEFGVNTPTDLSTLLKESSNWDKITWTINGTVLGTSPINNSVFTYTPSDKNITFKNVRQTYLCSAAYNDGTNQHTDYFFVVVKNDFLRMETKDCVTGTDYVLTEFLKDSSIAASVTWTLDTTSLNTDLNETNFSYTKDTTTLQFKAAGTYTLKAVNTYGGVDKEENIILTVTAPTPANP